MKEQRQQRQRRHVYYNISTLALQVIIGSTFGIATSTIEVVIPDNIVLNGAIVQQEQEQEQQQKLTNNTTVVTQTDRTTGSTASRIAAEVTGTDSIVASSSSLLLLSTCRTFIAQSTIPGAGLGMFSGQQFQRGDQITTGDGVVPVIDSEWNSNLDSFDNQYLWDEYVWSANTFPGMEEVGHSFEAASFGIGALPNCYFPMLNAHDSYADLDYGNVNEPGIDPGTGAFTPYHNRRGTAKKVINPGDEIFVDYGYGYFKGDRTSPYGLIPFLHHYDHADQLLKDFRRVSRRLSSYNDIAKQLQTSAEKTHVNDVPSPIDTVLNDDDLYDLVKNVIMTWPSRIQGALPSFAKDIPHVLDVLGSTSQVHAQRSRRNIDWVYENGLCLDHLVIKNSTLKHAGRGAFANKYIPAGAVVAPVPLIHIPDRKTLNMYGGYVHTEDGYPTYIRNESNLLHAQLLLNYCFGHRLTSLLLCPYGVASSLVNHGGASKSNAKIVWSDKITTKPEYFNMSIKEFGYIYKSGLAFEYVATRDIQEDEEVLIDYGIEWETAWEEHLANWVSHPPTTKQLNDADPPIELPLYNQWTYPGDIHLWCRETYREMRGLFLDGEGHEFHPCRVVSKSINNETGEVQYTAELRIRNHGDTSLTSMTSGCYEVFDEIMFNVPRDAFVFGTAIDSNSKDIYRLYKETWSFRHDIRIPDHLIPNIWKDLI